MPLAIFISLRPSVLFDYNRLLMLFCSCRNSSLILYKVLLFFVELLAVKWTISSTIFAGYGVSKLIYVPPALAWCFGV